MIYESWIPLFDIFLNSACPEAEASQWLQKMFNPPSTSPPLSTAFFLSLLMRPSGAASIQHSEKRIMWIQTLPSVVQARILSFLAYEHQRFCRSELCRLARIMLSEGKCIDFWVKKAAQQLLDLVSVSNHQWLSLLNLDSEEETAEDEFYSMPDWLTNAAKDSELMFPWLPISTDELSDGVPFIYSGGDEDDVLIDAEESKKQHVDEVMLEIDEDESKCDGPIDMQVEEVAKSLKTKLLHIDCGLRAMELAKEIRELCLESRSNRLVILDLIEPWNVDDETAAILTPHLYDKIEAGESDWSAHILSSIVLPKFLLLKESPSRVLVNATIDYCRSHQRAAEYALLLPLILRSDGINNPICDVITRIIRESLHPAHVSAFFRKLLTKDEDARRFICLPSHQSLIGEELVWTESLFSLWRNILDHNVHLMQDSVDQLVYQVCKHSNRYSKSLKFANFVLCLVNKCTPLLRPHKLMITAAVENSDTLVTKSLLSKLSAL